MANPASPMSTLSAHSAWDSSRIDRWIPAVCTCCTSGMSTPPRPAARICRTNAPPPAAPWRSLISSAASAGDGRMPFDRTNAGVTYTLPKADDAPTAGNCPGEATIPTMRTAASLGRLASGLPTTNLTTLPTRRSSRSAVGKSTIASPGARRLTIRPETTLNRLSRKPARPIKSVTAISSGAGATRPDGKIADDATISIRAHCATSGSASIFANARPGSIFPEDPPVIRS